MTSAVALYDDALLRRGTLHLVQRDGSRQLLDLVRYRSPVDDVDRDLVRRCVGATLDIGCGPGRFVSAVMRRGLPALGVDVAPATVAAARAAGASVLQRSVFDSLPGEGRWATVLLLDENIGIGGHPEALLRRVCELLAPGGRALIETDGDPDRHDRVMVRVQDDLGQLSQLFPWAHLGSAAVARVAEAADLRVDHEWSMGGRAFVSLARRFA